MHREELAMWIRPPQTGGEWLDPLDREVGSAYYHSEYFWTFRAAIQVRVRDGIIVEAKCSVDDDTSAATDEELAGIIVAHLTGRPVGEAVDIAHAAFWHISLPKEAIYDALKSWAYCSPEREAKLPPTPYEPPQPMPGALQRLLRRFLGA